MKIEIGDLVMTQAWVGIVVDKVEDAEYIEDEYKVHFFFPDDRLPTRWCTAWEINKWKKVVEQVEKMM